MEKILSTDLPREKGFIYFVKENPLCIYRAQRGRKKAIKEEPEKPPTEEPKKEEEQPEKLKEPQDEPNTGEEEIPF